MGAPAGEFEEHGQGAADTGGGRSAPLAPDQADDRSFEADLAEDAARTAATARYPIPADWRHPALGDDLP